jgi:hypothetical protein
MSLVRLNLLTQLGDFEQLPENFLERFSPAVTQYLYVKLNPVAAYLYPRFYI